MADKESSFPWFRFYTEASHDIKLETIAEELQVDYLLIIGAWTMLLCMASESPIRGSLYVTDLKRYSNGSVTSRLKCSEELSIKILKSFVDFGMLEIDGNGAYRIVNWLKRNPPSDNSSERVQKHREKEKCNGNVTLQSRYSNGLDIDKDLNKDKEKIKNTTAKPTVESKLKQPISEKKLRDQLIDRFKNKTKLEFPDDVPMSTIQKFWWTPAKNMIVLGGGIDEAWNILEKLIDQFDTAGLNYADLHSFVKTFNSEVAKQQRNPGKVYKDPDGNYVTV